MSESPAIDSQQIRKLALGGATDRDICEYLGLTEALLQEQFGTELVQARASRRVSLRNTQTAAAIKGNVRLLTLLGKHELGQTDKGVGPEAGKSEPRLDYKMG
jgi:hypothetical protein